VLIRDGLATDPEMRSDVQNWRDTDAREVPQRQRLSAVLGIDEAAVADEGFVIYSPSHAALARALASALKSAQTPVDTRWRLVSDRAETLESLTSDGAETGPPRHRPTVAYEYIGLKRM
jgi:hypothetical protein